MPAKPKNQINLLPSEEFEGTTLGRILKWALTSFRVMVIGVQLVVIGAFLSRFYLDAKNTDLNDEIKSLQAEILANEGFEKEFKKTQDRILIYKNLSSDEHVSSSVSNITSRLPIDVALASINVSEDSVSLKGATANEASISQFLINLSSEESFENINLTAVNSSTEGTGQFEFTIRLDLKKTEN